MRVCSSSGAAENPGMEGPDFLNRLKRRQVSSWYKIMKAISKKSLLVIATSGALVLSAFARGHVQIISGGSRGSGSFNSGFIIPGVGTTGPTTPGVAIPGQGSRPSVGGLPGLNGPGTMTPGTGQSVPALPSLIGH